MSATLNLGTDGQWATKENSLLGYNSENGNYKPLPFDFTRASNGTFVNKSGLIETAASGVPRIDFLGNTSGALKLEPQRTNLVTYSSDFSNAYWTKSASSVVSGFVSPDGGLNAFKLVEGTNNSKHFISINNLFTPDGVTRDYSIFVKEGERRYIFITNVTTTNNDINCVVFDTRDGVFTNTNDPTYILNRNVTTLSNGWYRIDFTSNVNSGSYDNFYIGISSSETMSGVSYQGDGTSGIYIYGAQVEVGSYATSLINTQGSAVTRVADACSQTVPDGIIGQTEGTVFLDFIYNHSNTSISESLSLSDGSSSNRLYVGNVFANTLSCLIIANSVVQFSAFTSYNLVIGQRYKAALCYKLNNFSFYVNGVEIATDTSGSVPLMNRIGFDSGSGTSNFYKPTNQVQLYNTRLSNSELQALTTI